MDPATLPRPAPQPDGGLTDAGGHGRAALLEALGAAVAGEAGHAVLARALPRRLVAGLAGGTNRVAVAGWVGRRRRGFGYTGGNEWHKPRAQPWPPWAATRPQAASLPLLSRVGRETEAARRRQ